MGRNWGTPLVMTNSSPWYRWPIEIDGLPTKNGGSFHSFLYVYQRVPQELDDWMDKNKVNTLLVGG